MGPRLEPVCPEPKVFVGQVPPAITRDDLVSLFSQYGQVKKCNLITGPDGRSRGCGMVTFEKWAQAEKAVDSEHGTTHFGGDRPMVVKFADPPKRGDGPVVGIAPKKLFVGQVPAEVTEDELRAIFSPYGNISELHLLQKQQGSGCAFVSYSTWAEAEQAIEGIDGKMKFPTAKASVIVKFADAKVPNEGSRTGEKRMYGDQDWQGSNKKTYGGSAMHPAYSAGDRNGMMLSAYGDSGPLGRMPGVPPMGVAPLNPGLMGGMVPLGSAYGDLSGMVPGPGIGGMTGVNMIGGEMAGLSAVNGAIDEFSMSPNMHSMGGLPASVEVGPMGTVNGGMRGDLGSMGLSMATGIPQGAGGGAGSMGHMVGSVNPMHSGPPHNLVGQNIDRQNPAGFSMHGMRMNAGMEVPGMNVGHNSMPSNRSSASQYPGKMGTGPTNETKQWKLFIGQVPFNAAESELWPVFQPFGEILELVILKGPDGRSKGCAFITYAHASQAEQAILHLNGKSLPTDTRGKILLVKFANVK